MNAELIILFVLAHILGDYYLQSEKIAEKKSHSFSWLILHSLIYALGYAALLVLFFSVGMLYAVLILWGAHFVIDLIKWLFERKLYSPLENDENAYMGVFKKKRLLYLLDQGMHYLTIFAVVFFMGGFIGKPELIFTLGSGFPLHKVLRGTLFFLVILKPVNITFKRCFTFFKPEKQKSEAFNAGAIIGDMERVLSVIFLILGQYTAIGLVFTAKSIARYKKISEDKEFAEYYLMGTLFSVISALVAFLLIWVR
jgi:hypothetical protein